MNILYLTYPLFKVQHITLSQSDCSHMRYVLGKKGTKEADYFALTLWEYKIL